MLKRLAFFLVIVLFAAVASATPVITSILPATSPVSGGVHVTMKGDGFATCPACPIPPLPPTVFFGSTAALSVRLVDAQTLDVVTPAHLPDTVVVSVRQFDGNANAPSGFTFTGPPSSAFEAVLLPIFTPPVRGAFGSQFVTDFRAFNLSRDQSLAVYGLGLPMFCSGIIILPPPFDPLDDPIAVAPRDQLFCSARTGNPGRLLWTTSGAAESLAANLRVVDVSRPYMTAGVEIPVVRMRDFRTDTIALLNVPIDNQGSGFRQQIRIYSLEPEPLTVNVKYFQTTVAVELRPGQDIFDPAYASFSEIQTPPFMDPPPATVDVLIESTDPARHIWAFATATNNATQLITTVSSN